jgi:protocatechuate 3,4-dioxygenase beta subunit
MMRMDRSTRVGRSRLLLGAVGRTLTMLTLAITSLPAALDGQVASPQVPPPRDSPQVTAPKTGTAVLRGRVVDAQGSRPLRRVRLSLTAPDIPQPQAISVSTDADGRYEFTELPARQFTLTAQRSGYLTLRYGQRRPMEQGKVLDVQDGQIVEGIDFALPRMGVISGRIVDELGEPIAGVWVAAMRSMWWQNRRQLASDSGLATTDEEGEYRIRGLMPGTYVLVARTLEKWAVDIAGRDETMSYAPSYFPGVADLSEAVRLTVASGQELTNTDFSVVPGRAARIAGRALDSQGRPLRNVILAHQFPGGAGGGIVGGAGSAAVAPDGTFSIGAVPPGEYRLQATGPQETAVMPISVNSVDLTGVALTTSAGWSLSGRITTDAGPLAGLRRNQVAIAPVLLVTSPLGMQGGAVARQTINEDWTFSVTNVAGPARLRVTTPDGWAVKALIQGDRDVANQSFDMKSGETVSDVQVVLTDRVVTVNGQVVDANDRPLADGTILLFAADAAKWFEGSPHVRAVRPDQQGRYRIGNLLPGEYLAVALDYVEQGIWNDPEYLESIRRYAQRVTLTDAVAQAISLTLVTP